MERKNFLAYIQAGCLAALDTPAGRAGEVTVGLYVRNAVEQEGPETYGLTNLMDLYLSDRICTLPALAEAETYFCTYDVCSLFRVTLPGERCVEAALGMLAELRKLSEAPWDREAFETAREECREACGRYRATFRRRLDRAVWSPRFRSAPLIGLRKTVGAFSPEQAGAWARAHTGPDDCCLCLTGEDAVRYGQALRDILPTACPPRTPLPRPGVPGRLELLPSRRGRGAVGLSFQGNVPRGEQLNVEALGFAVDDLLAETGMRWEKAWFVATDPVTLQLVTRTEGERAPETIRRAAAALRALPELLTEEKVRALEEDLCRVYRREWDDPLRANGTLGENGLFRTYETAKLLDLAHNRPFLSAEKMLKVAAALFTSGGCTAVVQGAGEEPGAVAEALRAWDGIGRNALPDLSGGPEA